MLWLQGRQGMGRQRGKAAGHDWQGSKVTFDDDAAGEPAAASAAHVADGTHLPSAQKDTAEADPNVAQSKEDKRKRRRRGCEKVASHVKATTVLQPSRTDLEGTNALQSKGALFMVPRQLCRVAQCSMCCGFLRHLAWVAFLRHIQRMALTLVSGDLVKSCVATRLGKRRAQGQCARVQTPLGAS